VLAFAVVQCALEHAKEPHQGLEIKVHCSMLAPDAMAALNAPLAAANPFPHRRSLCRRQRAAVLAAAS
jgi:hypothetical protein